jgi:hypothetical protein
MREVLRLEMPSQAFLEILNPLFNSNLCQEIIIIIIMSVVPLGT